jgi:hypothetical protein
MNEIFAPFHNTNASCGKGFFVDPEDLQPVCHPGHEGADFITSDIKRDNHHPLRKGFSFSGGAVEHSIEKSRAG